MMGTMSFLVVCAGILLAFLFGLMIGRIRRPEPYANHFDKPWSPPAPQHHVVDLAKPEPAVDDEDDAIDRLITAVVDAIDELEGPLPPPAMLGHEATVPFDKELPITVNGKVLIVTRGNPDADEYAEGDKSNIRLLWKANSALEEIPLDYDQGYEIESAIVNWEDRLADFTDGEARRLANDLAKRFYASS